MERAGKPESDVTDRIVAFNRYIFGENVRIVDTTVPQEEPLATIEQLPAEEAPEPLADAS